MDIRQRDVVAHRKAIGLWIVHFLFCLLLLLQTGTSGLTEAMFIITTGFQLFWLMRWSIHAGIAEEAQALQDVQAVA